MLPKLVSTVVKSLFLRPCLCSMTRIAVSPNEPMALEATE